METDEDHKGRKLSFTLIEKDWNCGNMFKETMKC